MGYSIIFETKIINLSDGRILHLDLSGCNNDDFGRIRSDFTGKIYSKEDFIKRAESFMLDGKPKEGWELKIGGKYASYYDYGKHLLRMMKRAITWDELDCVGRYIHIALITEEKQIVLNNEAEVIAALDEYGSEYILFYIGKLAKKKKN